MYNLFLISHNKITQKENYLALKQTLRMKNKSIIIKDFNLHHFH